MLHKEFFGLIFLGFVFWIIAATTPTQRIENACRPIGWTGSVITSVSALVLPAHQGTVQNWFDTIEYGCRYTAWRLFYQDAYNQWKASVAAEEATPAARAPATKEPAPVVAPAPPEPAAVAAPVESAQPAEPAAAPAVAK